METDHLTDRMGSEPILTVKRTVTMYTNVNVNLADMVTGVETEREKVREGRP